MFREDNIIPIIIFLLSIGLQLIAAVFALFLIRTTGRKLAWIFLSLAMVLMAGRRLVSFVSFLLAGKEVPLQITELIALVISCLMLAGVLHIEKYFRSIRSNEDALRKSEATNRALLNAIPDLMFRIKRDGAFLDFKAAKDFDLYAPPGEFLDKKIYEVLPKDVAQSAMHYLEQALQTGNVQIFEYQLLMRGNVHDFEARIVASGENEVLTIVRDITEHKRAEDVLRESENRYRRLIESVTDYIYTVQVDNGRATAISHGPGCIAVTGYSSQDYEADPYLWYRMVYEEDRKAVVEQAAKILSGKAIDPLEHRIIHKDGRIRWVKNDPVPHYDQHGCLSAYYGLVSDITERKKLEEQLRHSQKMEAIGQLAGGIAHDFNNILTTIIGYGSLLKMSAEKNNSLISYVEHIITSAERASGLIQQILAFSRKQTLNPKPVNLNEIIRKIEALLLRLIGENIELKTILTDIDLIVMADSAQIEQVLMNLCTNARDAMPGGGLVTIESELVELDEEYLKTHAYGKRGKYALISVADTGMGMDEKTRERIFEPFFTTKEVGKGTGLGLSIVYGAIKQHNGYITVYSEPYKGTTFKIYFPLIESKIDEAQSIMLPSLEGGTETILVAEDNKEVRELIKNVLECYGYKVIEAEDGEDVINKFEMNKDKIQLLILDAIMPKRSGREAYEEIEKIGPAVKVLYMSGYPADVISKKGILEEGVNFISKPISSHDLLMKVREVLDKF